MTNLDSGAEGPGFPFEPPTAGCAQGRSRRTGGTGYGMRMFGKNRGMKASRNRRLVFVSQEHGGDLIEKYFTTLDRVEEEFGGAYEDPNMMGYETLTDEVKNDGQGWMNTKYRYIYVKEVTPENVREIVNGLEFDWISDENPATFMEDVEYRRDNPTDGWSPEMEFINVTDEELEYLGYSKSEIKKARKAAEKGDPYPLYDMWKQTWDPRYTPEEVYPQLEGLGVPRKLYDPAVNKYRGSGRGTFNLRGR